MRSLARVWKLGAVVGAAFLGGLLGSAVFRPGVPSAGLVDAGAPGGIAATFGVGGVLTQAGEFWQYRPDKETWVPLDESFALEGQATSVVPLPVPVAGVRHLETFGFLVTDETCYLYDLDQRRWVDIGRPPAR